MRHVSLFSGLGGFDLAASWMGWENVLQCEIDPFCQRVLKHHFPSSKLYGDIRTLDGNEWKGKIDILTGGFPCQPFSAAGRRRGTEDNRFLWPQMLRVIREIEPTWIVAENVRGLASIDNGLVFERVCSELEANGYEVQPFCIPACAVGAPHRRERLWIVAHDTGEQDAAGNPDITRLEGYGKHGECSGQRTAGKTDCDVTDSECINIERWGINRELGAKEAEESRKEQQRKRNGDSAHNRGWQEHWLEAATRLCRVDDEFSRGLDTETISQAKWRRESLKAYGNAIVPAVAFQIFLAIEKASSVPSHHR
ncbi:MAG: cytosine specific methyltransferase [Siphoviridae sp. ctpQM7]|nr:MAG: cytosine specific methyltransferase [Siphoviridae sp. ctpQM7]